MKKLSLLLAALCCVFALSAADYYLEGYINGADYTGQDYKFVNGTIKATFTQDSYVFVKDGSAQSYMTEGWLGDVTSATLYKSPTKGDKMKVPGGIELTFTLVENTDGTLTLSYALPAVEGPKEYYLVGYLNNADYLGTDYVFVDGKLDIEFSAVSYIYVRDNGANSYFAAAYVDATAATAGEVTLAAGKNYTEKMGVPAGKLTFTLVENADNTLIVSFAEAGEISALENTSAERTTARKIVENGQIYILRDGVRYNIFGAQVK